MISKIKEKIKRKYTRIYKEGDRSVIVSYDPTLFFKINYPGEYVDFEEV